ncbi:MAG: RNA polymerase sigma factor [Phycisphaerae bacterium]|nr:RNA polymerase sigma factor [Phycisphaerae bacterium]MDW8262336.1 RNA polymerase sigma factor [Phycisphaerales bacterium]
MPRDDGSETFLRLMRSFTAEDRDSSNQLLQWLMTRIQRLARRQLRDFPAVARWEQTDDIVQAVAIRLQRALASVRPANQAEMMAFCSTLIRRELIDLKRKHFGPMGIGTHHASPPPSSSPGKPLAEAADTGTSGDPARLARWTELHETASRLPEDLRRVFELIWYLELTHAQAAKVLGVSTKTVSRRWREARIRLHHLLSDEEI